MCLTSTYYYLCLFILLVLWSLPTRGCFFRPFVKRRLALTHRGPRVARLGAAHGSSRVLPALFPSNRTCVRHTWHGLWSAKAAPQRRPQHDPLSWRHMSPVPVLITLLGGVTPAENLLEYLTLLCRAAKKDSFAIFTDVELLVLKGLIPPDEPIC